MVDFGFLPKNIWKVADTNELYFVSVVSSQSLHEQGGHSSLDLYD